MRPIIPCRLQPVPHLGLVGRFGGEGGSPILPPVSDLPLQRSWPRRCCSRTGRERKIARPRDARPDCRSRRRGWAAAPPRWTDSRISARRAGCPARTDASGCGPWRTGRRCARGCVVGLSGRDRPELAEADRVLRPAGRLLVVHDYGRDDVSRLRGDLRSTASGAVVTGRSCPTGFRIRVLHCFWTFDSVEHRVPGRRLRRCRPQGCGASLKRPRLSYNVAIYHRTRGGVSE